MIRKVKVSDLQISLTDGHQTFDLVPHLKGDSSVTEPRWRHYQYKKLPYSWGKVPYFETIADFVEVINNHAERLDRIPDNDYIFWLDKEIIPSIPFHPKRLELKIVLTDSTNTAKKIISDFVLLQ